MFTEEQFQKSRNPFMAGLVIAFLFATCMYLSGCSTIAAAGIGVYNTGKAACQDTAKVLNTMADDQ